MMEVTAGHESFEHLALDRSVDEPGRVDFVAMSANTPIQVRALREMVRVAKPG